MDRACNRLKYLLDTTQRRTIKIMHCGRGGSNYPMATRAGVTQNEVCIKIEPNQKNSNNFYK